MLNYLFYYFYQIADSSGFTPSKVVIEMGLIIIVELPQNITQYKKVLYVSAKIAQVNSILFNWLVFCIVKK